jgi:hypothetical protein
MPISSPADVVNESYRAMGVKLSVGDLYEGSPQARAALEIYGQTRDEVLRAGEWSFAYGDALLTLLKGPAPNGGYNPNQAWSTLYPLPPWIYEYAYPSDCIELRDIIKQPKSLPVLDPKPVVYRVNNDPVPVVTPGNPPTVSGPPQRVILTNAASPVAIYTRRVTNLLLWPPDFTGTLITALAAKLATSPVLAANPDVAKMLPTEAARTGLVAQQHQG